MKPVLIIIIVSLVFPAMCLCSVGQQACEPVAVRASAEVAGPEFSLADLLAPSACPALLRAAARVRLGSAPLEGSVRVLAGDEVRSLFQKIAGSGESAASVPERIVVRRAGVRASCPEIGAQILEAFPVWPPAHQSLSPSQFDCGATGRIPQASRLEPTRIRWNPALSSWEVSVRCARSADCVPFLVRVRGCQAPADIDRPTVASAETMAQPATAWSAALLHGSVHAPAFGLAGVKPLVRAGETATLSWDERGIHLVVPVVCLEPGGIGQEVRVRILRGSRTLRAVVVSAGQLRAAS